MALVAGAIRSGSVVDRFYARLVTPDISIYNGASVVTRDDVAALPGVERTAVSSFIAFLESNPRRIAGPVRERSRNRLRDA